MTYDEFIEAVADELNLATEEAEAVVDATLETLAERISGGEVEDLMSELPEELRPPLERGNEESHGAARKMSLEEFVHEVAEREGATPDDAQKHARAVFKALRQAVDEDEFEDVVAQLPDEYTVLLAR
ncbi:MAG: DUF2267 domain-containing protein [Thermoleophilaceae bacterium]|jgi:uncharacterized protein (DUF2267 family)